MPLSEKELERFLWEQPRECEARGLEINRAFFAAGRRYRRLPLGPYGVAPLVSVRYWPPDRAYYVQVLVFTKAALTSTLYQHAKRYLTALRDALRQALRAADVTAGILPSCVLIGQRVQVKGDFVYILNHDADCQAFTYSYGVDGLSFQNVSRCWAIPGSGHHPALTELAADLLAHRQEALSDGDGWAVPQDQQAAEVLPQHLASMLVVTAEGVLSTGAFPESLEPGSAKDE